MLLEYIQNATTLEEIMRLPPELTDLLCYMMEDSTMPFQLDSQFREFFVAKMASQADGQAAAGAAAPTGTTP